METKFTPGPWEFSIPECSNGYFYVDTKSTKNKSGEICTSYGDNAKNNAHLISCAPEMYELLKKISELIPELNPEDPYIDIDAMERDIKNLLAKARGEQ